MGKSTITITMDDALLKTVDRLVEKSVYPDRSLAIQQAVREKFRRADKDLLERELAKMDPEYEQRMANEFLPRDLSEWPEY
ncbi:MAG: ribbon-helix-helix domain-containing protein [Chloroflexi bacterium]|nr:ribbon-helix-helix domain-containing protein [Chloroflexota bacterium]